MTMAKAVSLLDCCEQFALRRTCAALVSPACRVELSDFAAQFTPDRRDRCADRPSQLDLGRLLLGLLLGVGGGRRHGGLSDACRRRRCRSARSQHVDAVWVTVSAFPGGTVLGLRRDSLEMRLEVAEDAILSKLRQELLNPEILDLDSRSIGRRTGSIANRIRDWLNARFPRNLAV